MLVAMVLILQTVIKTAFQYQEDLSKEGKEKRKKLREKLEGKRKSLRSKRAGKGNTSC